MSLPKTLAVASLLLAASTSVAVAQPDLAPKAAVVPAGANAPAQTIGPLPVAPAMGAQPSAKDDPRAGYAGPLPSEEGESLLGMLVRTLLVLGVVVALVYVVLNFGLRRLLGNKVVPFGKKRLVQVVERIPLDPKRSMFVVKAAGQYLLVGGGEQALSVLCTLDAAQVELLLSEGGTASTGSTSTGPSPFLTKLLARKGDKPPGQV